MTVRNELSRWLGLLILCAGWTTTMAASAAALNPPATAASAVASKANAIPMAEILTQADRDQWVVDRIRRQLARSDPSAGLSAGLADLSKSVEDKRRTYTAQEIRQLAVMRLESLDRYWALDQRRFEEWQALAARRLAPLAEDAALLERLRRQWEVTLTSQAPMPAAMADRISALLEDLGDAEQRVAPLLAHQIALGQEARELGERIQTGREAVQEVIGAADQRLLQREVPPLWSTDATPPMSAASATALSDQGLDLEANFASDYLTTAALKVQATTVVQLMLLALMLWAAARVRRERRAGIDRTAGIDEADVAERADVEGGADGVGQASRSPPPEPALCVHRLLSRPLSAWLLLGMLVTLPLRTDAPLMTRELALLIALVPALRLLPVSPLRGGSPLPQTFIGLYALKWLCLLALDQALLYRVLLMGLAIITMAWLWLALRRVHAGPLWGAGRLSTLHRAWGWTAVAGLAVGALAQLTGHVTLGQTLINGLFDIAYLGLLLHLGLSVVIALLRLLAAGSAHGADVESGATAGVLTSSMGWRRHLPKITRVTRRVLHLAVNLGWLVYAAGVMRVQRPVQSAVETVLALRIEVGEISVSLGDLLVFALSVAVAAISAQLVRAVLRNRLNDSPALPRGAGNSIASLSYYAVLLLGFMVALSAAGFKVSQLALVFGALGVGIGFGLQGIVSNFVSGLVLMFERPIQPGDMIEIGDIPGRVRQIGLRATVLRTSDGADVVVPNSALLGGNLKNWTLFDRRRRIELPISVSYGSDVSSVLRILQSVATGSPGVANDPAPVALFMGLAPSSMDFSLRVWTPDFDHWMDVRSELLVRLLAAFKAADIAIPLNQLDVNLRQVGEAMAATGATGPAGANEAAPRA